MFYYRVYGLAFQSDYELPLDRSHKTSVIDYYLRFGDPNQFEVLRREFHCPWYVSPRRVKCGRTVVKVWKTEACSKFLFSFYDGVEFIIDRQHKDIWIGGVPIRLLQGALRHLLFSLTGFLLGLRKSVCLHGAAIGWRNGAIALLGESYSGKSILSAKMVARGVEVLSDELVALDVVGDAVKVHYGFPWICLRSGSLRLLRTDGLNAGQLTSKWQYLDEAHVSWNLGRIDDASQLAARKLTTIYFLSPVGDPMCEAAIEQIPPHQALMALMGAAGRTHISYPEFRPQEFRLMGSVVSVVPTYRLRYHVSDSGLTALSGLLVRSFQDAARPREQA
jgi:hypothetical protein